MHTYSHAWMPFSKSDEVGVDFCRLKIGSPDELGDVYIAPHVSCAHVEVVIHAQGKIFDVFSWVFVRLSTVRKTYPDELTNQITGFGESRILELDYWVCHDFYPSFQVEIVSFPNVKP